MDSIDYSKQIKAAVRKFWRSRSTQIMNQKSKKVSDAGNRGAVTGGKQLDGFLELLKKIAIDTNIPKGCIYLKGNILPGFFRPTKDWDMLIISPTKKLIAVIELKSQVGSFGNNFNNRTEEALGSAVDLWTAFREKAFPNQSAPWVGYLMVVEKSEKSKKTVKISEPHFKT
ncbi:MAG: PaeR7I family type II restriction endonuclease, partial [Bacteroidetes bacterium]|nr:PaeR7I family type II restriction endonuclease [Bacteroidota bacterium]